jgi:membrane protease YdiL (CAAX protease family)
MDTAHPASSTVPAPRRRPAHGWPLLSPAWTLALVPAVSLALALLFASPWLPRDGLVCAGIAALLQYAVLLGPARQRARDVGWRAQDLAPAALAGVALWSLMHAPALASWLGGVSPQVAPPWSGPLGGALGPLLAQLAATALVEETVFRGWLWPQLAARLSAHVVPRFASVLAAVMSQAAFALLHLPVLLSGDGAVVPSLLVLFATGLVFVGVYAATGNLWLAVAVHALGNAPTLLLAPPPDAPAPTMLLLAGTLAIAAVAWLRRRRSRRR